MSGGKSISRMLVTLALLSAIQVVLARFIIPMPGPTMRFSIEAVPIIVAGLLFGSLPGAAVGLVGDAVGCLFSGYGFNPVFSVPPILIGLCSGFFRFLVIRRFSYLRVLMTFLPAVALGSVLWQSYWLAFFYGTRTFTGFMAVRAVQFAITAPIDAAIVMGLFRTRMFETLGLWPRDEGKSHEH